MTPDERRERITSLTNLIENFRRKNLSKDPRCLAAMEELNLLRFHLEPRKSVAEIRRAAEMRQYVTYGQVAQASGLKWQEARRTIDSHLDALCGWAHSKGWPLITAVVVEKPNLATGLLDGIALQGFLKTARRLGYAIGSDETGFLRVEQEKVFEWAEMYRGRELFPADREVA